MDEVMEKIVRKIRSAVKERITPAIAEEIFGVTVKRNKKNENDTESDTWNIYDSSGKLLLPNLKGWDVDDLFKQCAHDISESLRNTAPEDNNTKGVEETAKEIKEEQEKYEEKYYRICLQCGERYNSLYQTHSHF